MRKGNGKAAEFRCLQGILIGVLLCFLLGEKVCAESSRNDRQAETQYYVVRKGDCLWHIAERQMGDGRRWQELYERNRKSIGGNPDLILPGEKLEIPEDKQRD